MKRTRPQAYLAIAFFLPLLVCGCYPYRLPAYTGSYPYDTDPGHKGRPGLEGHSPWSVIPESKEEMMPDGASIRCDWKERMAQPYVFLNHTGDYRFLGSSIRRLLELGRGLSVDGPPFALYFDDPATTPADELRARVCLPVQNQPEKLIDGLSYEVLPRSMVVYAQVPGPYDETGRSYGAVFTYMQKLGWERSGPLREIYLVNPAEVSDHNDLRAEVQVPARVR